MTRLDIKPSKTWERLRSKLRFPKQKPKLELENKVLKSQSPKQKKKWWEIEFGKIVPDRILLQITRQLSILGQSGVPILDSIDLLIKTTKHKRMRQTLEDIGFQLRNGVSLSAAISQHSNIFPIYYSSIIEASEHSGDLNMAFETLTIYIERDFNAKRTLKSATYYPAILIVISILAIFILSIMVLPKFEVFFESLNAELPTATRALLAYARFMAEDWKSVVFVIATIILIFNYIRSKPRGRFLIDQKILQLPLFGKIITLVILERFTRILGTLSSAGVPILNGLDLVGKTINNVVFTGAIKSISEGVLQGRGFVEPLEETKVFPEETIQILRVGEQSGRLSEQLEYASSYYAKEVDYLLKNVGNLIEPIILVFVGGGVGFVAIALVSAMYGIYSSTAIIGG